MELEALALDDDAQAAVGQVDPADETVAVVDPDLGLDRQPRHLEEDGAQRRLERVGGPRVGALEHLPDARPELWVEVAEPGEELGAAHRLAAQG